MKTTILVIDDEESIRFTLERFLSSAGYRVMTARDCSEARDCILTGDIDLIFSDLILPDGTGVDLLKEIRTRRPSCPVILMTAYPSAASVAEAFCMGACDYIQKPVRQEVVLGCVTAALKEKPAGACGSPRPEKRL